MTPYQDYPRMMFHRGDGLTTVVLSRDEEDGLGANWRRTVWPAEPIYPPIALGNLPAEPAPASPLVGEQPEPSPASAAPETDESGDPLGAPQVSDEASGFEPAPKKPARKRR